MSTAYNLQDGDILDSEEVEEIVAVFDSLVWIVTFCNEHPEWFGVGGPDAGAEHEWLAKANKLLEKA